MNESSGGATYECRFDHDFGTRLAPFGQIERRSPACEVYVAPPGLLAIVVDPSGWRHWLNYAVPTGATADGAWNDKGMQTTRARRP